MTGLAGASRRRPSEPSLLERIGLPPRLFLTDALVIVAGAGTLLAVALLFAPTLFHEHLQRAHLPQISAVVRDHVDEAFYRALLIALAVAVSVATVVAGMISWLVARRLAAGSPTQPRGWPTATTTPRCPIPASGRSSPRSPCR